MAHSPTPLQPYSFQQFHDELMPVHVRSRSHILEGHPDRTLVLDEIPLRGYHFEHPVTIRNFVFKQFVDFSEWRCEATLRIKNCSFEAGLRLADTSVGGLFSIKESELSDHKRKWFDFRRLRVQGVMDCTSLIAHACLDLDGSFIDKDIWFYNVHITSAINDDTQESEAKRNWQKFLDKERTVYNKYRAIVLAGATIMGSLFIMGYDGKRVAIAGQINMISVRIDCVFVISKAIIVSFQELDAIQMESAVIGGPITIRTNVTVRGNVNMSSAVIGAINTNATIAQRTEMRYSQAIDRSIERHSLIDGNWNLTFATIHGYVRIEHIHLNGIFIARHVTVEGDLDLCGSVIGRSPINDTWYEQQFDVKQDYNPKWNDVEVDPNRPFLQADRGEAIRAVNLELADIHGQLWIRGTRVLGTVFLEDAEIDGEANFDQSEVLGDLQLRSAVIKGRVFADEKNDTAYPQVKGIVDLSYAEVQQVDVKFGKIVRLTPVCINFTGARIDTIAFRGEVDSGEPPFLITEGVRFTALDCRELRVTGPGVLPSRRDLWRYGLWTTGLCLVLVQAAIHQSLILAAITLLLAFFSAYGFARDVSQRRWGHRLHAPWQQIARFYRWLFFPRWRMITRARRGLGRGQATRNLLDHLDQTYPFSRGYYLQVERMLRGDGDDATADEVFHMRRRRESEAPWSATHFAQTPSSRWQRIMPTRGIKTPQTKRFVEVAHALKPAVRERRDSPSGFRHIWSVSLDFLMGYGVRTHRLFHIFLLIWLVNTSIFLNENSVERPISFVQIRGDLPPQMTGNYHPEPGGKDAGPPRMPTNPWPSDGGKPNLPTPSAPGEWNFRHAFFMAMRIQVPALGLVTENDWSPATREMDEFGGLISYADYASLMMVLNLILIPLMIAGATGYLKKNA